MDDPDKRVTAMPGADRKVRAQGAVGVASDSHAWASLAVAVAHRADRVAFMRIYDHFAPRLQRYASSLGASPARADEIVQDTLLTLWRKAALFDPSRASLDAWLFRIARNLFIDQVRREPHWRPLQEGLDQLDAGCVAAMEAGPEGFVDQRALAAAIEGLPATQARLVRMCWLEARSHREIATETGMPIGSVAEVDRKSQPGSPKALVLELESVMAVADTCIAQVTRHNYPTPPEPQAFSTSQFVELAHGRWQAYCQGREPLPSAAYFVFTVLTTLGGSARGAAARFEIDKAVLDKWSAMSALAGGADALRKFSGALPIQMSDAERVWLEAVVKRVIRRLAEAAGGAALRRVTMADLPTLP